MSKTVNKRLIKAAKARGRLNRLNAKALNPLIVVPAKTSKVDFLNAMKGTAGILTLIATNLGSKISTVKRLLERQDWQDVRQLWVEELESGIEEAKEAIRHAITQRVELPVMAKAAAWLLERLQSETYGKKVIQVHEGGSRPIQHVGIQIPVTALDLPPELQRQLLQAIDKHEDEQFQAENRKLIENKVV